MDGAAGMDGAQGDQGIGVSTISGSRTDDTVTVTYTLNDPSGATTPPAQTVSYMVMDGQTGMTGPQGAQGPQGSFIEEIFFEAQTAPAAPTGGSYDIATGVLTPPTGWTTTPTDPTAPNRLFESSTTINPATFTEGQTTFNIGSGWSAPYEAGSQGPTGPRGQQGFQGLSIVELYIVADNQPVAPTAATTDGINFTNLNGWTADFGSLANTGTIWISQNHFDPSMAGLTGAWTTPHQLPAGTGAQGPAGPRGPAGPAGETGTAGAAATIAVGTTSTGNAGTNANVTNSGTANAAVFNFTILVEIWVHKVMMVCLLMVS